MHVHVGKEQRKKTKHSESGTIMSLGWGVPTPRTYQTPSGS